VVRGLEFDRVADVYDRVRPGYPESLIEVALADSPIRDVLEVGCGTGQLTAALVARGLRVEAVEPGARLAARARERAPGASIHVARFEEIALAAASFDAVFSATAFHWVDPAIGWAKAARVLRKHGLLALLSHVYVTDETARPAHEALRDIYGAAWRLRSDEDLIQGALERRGNISELWAWLENPAIVVPEAGRLFGEARFAALAERSELTAAELLDLQRTTSTHLTLDPASRERAEREIPELVERLGGSFPIRQLAVVAVAQRRVEPWTGGTVISPQAEALVRRFFEVMNGCDATDLARLFADDIEIVMGPHVARGLAQSRLARDPPDLLTTSEPMHIDVRAGRVVVSFRRRQVWRESNELALEEDLWATFELAGGRIKRAELLRAPPSPDAASG